MSDNEWYITYALNAQRNIEKHTHIQLFMMWREVLNYTVSVLTWEMLSWVNVCTDPVVERLGRVYGETVLPAVSRALLVAMCVWFCGRPSDTRELGQEPVSRRGACLRACFLVTALFLVTPVPVYSSPSFLRQSANSSKVINWLGLLMSRC